MDFATMSNSVLGVRSLLFLLIPKLAVLSVFSRMFSAIPMLCIDKSIDQVLTHLLTHLLNHRLTYLLIYRISDLGSSPRKTP